MNATPTIHFASPPEVADGFEWRVVIRDSAVVAGERALDYEFRAIGEDCWRGQALWPPGAIPSAALALYAQYRTELVAELQPDRYPALPGF